MEDWSNSRLNILTYKANKIQGNEFITTIPKLFFTVVCEHSEYRMEEACILQILGLSANSGTQLDAY